jgi:hypothetical protein
MFDLHHVRQPVNILSKTILSLLSLLFSFRHSHYQTRPALLVAGCSDAARRRPPLLVLCAMKASHETTAWAFRRLMPTSGLCQLAAAGPPRALRSDSRILCNGGRTFLLCWVVAKHGTEALPSGMIQPEMGENSNASHGFSRR